MMLNFRNLLVSMTGLMVFLGACSGNSTRADSSAQGKPICQKITPDAAYRMMRESDDFILLDVRSNEEFLERHIAGAILLPVNELEKRVESELPDKNAVIIVYCRSGARSANAAKILVEKSYAHVHDMGGIIDWPFETVGGN